METKSIYLQADKTTYKELQSFETVADMDEIIRIHKDAQKLSKTELEVLEVISQFSCKYPGVSYLSKSKIAEKIGKVRRTIIRACNRLENLGIIRQYETKRVTGDRRQSSNIIVICPMEQVEKEGEQECDVSGSHAHLSQQKAILKSIIKPSTHTRDENKVKDTDNDGETIENDQAGKRALKTGIPGAIYSVLEPFFDARDLYEVYGILLRAKASIDRRITLEDNAESYINEFLNVIRKYKLGEVRNFKGLLYFAWQKVTSVVSRQIADRNAGNRNRAELFAEVMAI